MKSIRRKILRCNAAMNVAGSAIYVAGAVAFPGVPLLAIFAFHPGMPWEQLFFLSTCVGFMPFGFVALIEAMYIFCDKDTKNPARWALEYPDRKQERRILKKRKLVKILEDTLGKIRSDADNWRRFTD